MDFLADKNPAEYVIEQDAAFNKSPKVEGTLRGAKAAVLAAPIGAAIQALRGKSPVKGALLAGLGAGLITGLGAATVQKYKNLRTEADLRYHLRNMVEREPTVALPDPEAMGQLNGFVRGFGNVYNPY